MKTVGLTGPTGAGKGLFCKAASKVKKVYVIDTDSTARRVVSKGSECLAELTEQFGTEILNPDGTLNRKKLATLAFSDEKKHGILNKITHKHILCDIEKEIELAEKNGNLLCIIDAPLLFESGANRLCDTNVAVLSYKESRLSRIKKRDSIDESHAKLRMSAQPCDSFYKEKCQHILYNNKSREEFIKDAQKLVQQLITVQ